ncbi:MAG TPA: tetratricopeptide repeat protein [Candidatus Polarisedimenticolia bacterium]|nr:tetratricopeptide repeat protein [Candidatus Polarisedimenticolia bacterium]
MGRPAPEGLDELTRPRSPAATGPLSFPRDLDTNGFLAQVHNNLGVIHSERREHERAEAEYRRALDLDPLLSAAWYNRGNDLLIAGQPREAIKKLDEALRLYPIDTWALNNRGRSWAALGKKSRARKDFEAALAIDPEFGPAKRNLGALEQKP